MGTFSSRLPANPLRCKEVLSSAVTDQGDLLDITELTRRLITGDESAYRIFFDAYVDRLSRYLLVVTGGDETAMRDALQETLRRVVHHIHIFSDEAVLWSWLTVLARSARADESRKHRRYFAFLDRFKQQAAIDIEVTRDDHRLDHLDRILDRCLSRLPSDERELMELKYFEHFSVREIAANLQSTEKAVESRLTRVRKKLKQAILAELRHEPHE